MNVVQDVVRSIVEPFLAAVIACGICLGGLYYVEPKYFTHPSHYMKDVPNVLIINTVKELPNCHERIKRYIMIAGEVKEQDINPNVTIMFCGDR